MTSRNPRETGECLFVWMSLSENRFPLLSDQYFPFILPFPQTELGENCKFPLIGPTPDEFTVQSTPCTPCTLYSERVQVHFAAPPPRRYDGQSTFSRSDRTHFHFVLRPADAVISPNPLISRPNPTYPCPYPAIPEVPESGHRPRSLH